MKKEKDDGNYFDEAKGNRNHEKHYDDFKNNEKEKYVR
jgi:hypothetical protein